MNFKIVVHKVILLKKRFCIPENSPFKAHREKKCRLEQSKDKNNQKNNKVWSDFRKLLKKEALKLILDVNNYTNSLTCQICKKDIKELSLPNYFQLYTDKKRIQFITFHFKCALKEGMTDDLNEILQIVDYIAKVKKK